jgi:BirA family biotin operon repressor/biotin-[acetyl-CoA-carboxylase] ligase
MMKYQVLQMLRKSQGDPISGEEISRQLGVSRTAVWKHIASLRQEGHQIISKPKVGYALVNSLDLLYPLEIMHHLDEDAFGCKIIYRAETGSTNNLAKEEADWGAPHGTAVIAERQLAGKGRRGKGWSSDTNKGIWMSLILRPDFSPQLAPRLTFVAAVAVIRAVEKITGIKLELKWPNDVYCRGKKVAGILTEMKAELDLIDYVVIGIGLNVNQRAEDFNQELKEIATSLEIIAEKKVNRQELVVGILKEFTFWYKLFGCDGFAPVLKEWKEWDITIGKQVIVTEQTRQYPGVAKGIDEEGNLLVEDDLGKTHRIYSGEVSIRVSN